MSEQDWLTSEDPAAMLRLVTAGPHPVSPGARASDRQLRLFACACCRRPWDGISADSQAGVKILEDVVDGNRPEEDAIAAWVQLREGDSVHLALDVSSRYRHFSGSTPWQATLLRDIFSPFRPVTVNPAWLTWHDGTVVKLAQAAYDERAGRKCHKCKSGLEFATWKEEDLILGKWKAVYRHCPDCGGTGTISDGTLDAERLAVIADALEEAGCTEEVILRHLRGEEFVDDRTWATQPLSGPHFRGCWAIDLLLGKE